MSGNLARGGIVLGVMLGVLMLLMGGCGGGSKADNAGGAGKDGLQIMVIPKGVTHDFWRSIHAGARKAASELEGVTVLWQGPQTENDTDAQIRVIENAVAKGVSGIVLAPNHDQLLAKPVAQAMQKKVPVLVIDSGLKGEPGKDYVSFVATDNFLGGKLGAKRLGEVLGGQGKVVMLRYRQGHASTSQREEGFLEGIKEFPGIEVVSSNQYGDATKSTALAKSENFMTQIDTGALTVDGIFCPNESTTAGMLLALKNLKQRGKGADIKFVGFDASSELVKGLEEGHLHGLVVQNPFKMGYEGVRLLAKHLKGEKVEPHVDTGVKVITLDNMKDPDCQELLHPPLEQYLKE
jgi:ribose transport system substrate-binding protein